MASNPDPESKKDPFLDHLRQRFSEEEELPSPAVWAALSPRLPAPNPWLTRYVGGGGVLGLLLGLLIGWVTWVQMAAPVAGEIAFATLRPAATSLRAAAPISLPAATNSLPPAPISLPAAPISLPAASISLPAAPISLPAASISLPATTISLPAATNSLPAATVSANVAIPALPALWASAVATDSVIQAEKLGPENGVRADSAPRVRANLVALVAAQQPVLLALQAELDTLRERARRAVPLADTARQQAVAPELAAVDTAAADSARRPSLAPTRRWAALLLAETTTAWGSLPGHNPATTREQLLGATTRSVAAEFRPTDRWAIRAGFGETRLRDQFRFATDSVHHSAKHDTTWTANIEVHQTRDSSFTTRIDSIGRPEPIINQQGQVVGYTTVYVPFIDTTYHITTRHDTIRTMKENVVISAQTRTERREQDLRPDYRFWSVPLAAQFRVVQRGRWSAGVNLGAHVLFFRGGYHATHDAATGAYRLRRIGATEGPFRPVSLALATGLEVRFRFTDRLSFLTGGAARGWAVGPLRTAPLPRWTFAAHCGLSWELGR